MHGSIITALVLVASQAFFPVPATLPLAAQPISEVVLERGPCLGACPAYRVTLRSDGTATFVGWNHVERIGVFGGTLSPEVLLGLAEAVAAARIETLANSYLQPSNDLPVVRTTVIGGDGARRLVRDHGAIGVAALEAPERLLRLQATIDSIAAGITWTLVSESPGVQQPGRLGVHQPAAASWR
jgi:hypothetical protein